MTMQADDALAAAEAANYDTAYGKPHPIIDDPAEPAEDQEDPEVAQ